MGNVVTAPILTQGVYPVRVCRNDAIVSGSGAANVAQLLNGIAGRRLKLIASRTWLPSDALDTTTDTTIARIHCHTSPNVRQVLARIVYVPANDSGAVAPEAYWTIQPSGGFAVVQPSILQTRRTSTAAASLFQNSYHYATQTLVSNLGTKAGLVGNTTYTITLNVADRFRVVGYALYELSRPTIDTTTKLGQDEELMYPGSEIFDRDVLNMWSDAQTIWKRQGTQAIAWSTHNGSSVDVVGSTYTNVLDASTGGYSTSAAGFYTRPEYRGSLGSTNVPVRVAVYAKCVGGGSPSGSVKFTDADGTIATISNIDAEGWYTATGNQISTRSSSVVVVEAKGAGGGETISVWSASMYEYLA